MLRPFTYALLVCCFLNSCNSNPEKKDITLKNYKDKYEITSETFLSDSLVKNLINSNSPIFLSSFWIGMTKEESEEVLRYLIEKDDVYGEVYSSEKRDYVDLTKENLRNPEFENNARHLRCTLTPKNKTLTCNFELIFEFMNGKNILKSIRVSIVEYVEFQDFNDLVSLYESKYGKPKNIQYTPLNNKNLFGETYRRVSFEKGNKLIDMTYSSENTREGGAFSPNQIHIFYDDKQIKEVESKRFEEQMMIENEKKQKRKEKIKRKNEQSLKNI